MLPIQLAIFKAIIFSAPSLQLNQPIKLSKPESDAKLSLPSALQGTVNASLLPDSLGSSSPVWDGTLALPFNEPNISISYPLSTESSQSSIQRPNIYTRPPGPVGPPDLHPLPKDWKYKCSDRLGANMNPSSCLDAWALLPAIENKISFGPRSASNTYDVGLPMRFLSSDGTCFIEPKLLRGDTEAYAKPSDAGITTAYVIRECVGHKAEGGSSFNTGSGNDLAVVVSKFDPKVVCSPQPFPGPRGDLVLKSCQAILDQMETSKDVMIFAQQSIHSELETAIPFYYFGPPQAPKCILRVSGRLPRQFCSWYTIWEAAVAITAMCIRQGKGGGWADLGPTGSLRVDMAKPLSSVETE